MPALETARDRDADLIRQLQADIAELRQRVTVLERTARPALDDASWLTVIANAVAGRVFSVSELRAHRRVDRALRRALAGMTAQQIGTRLRQLTDRRLNGLILQRVGRDEAGCSWLVRHVEAGTDTHDRV